MSLVGNLEDLSLGDILQIISLSQKVGVLALESECGTGRIVFSAGLIHGACLTGVDGHFSDLRSLVVGKGLLDPAGFDACESRSADLGLTVEELLRSEASLDIVRLDRLIQEAVEAAVLEMFKWPSGNFSFDVHRDPDDADSQLILRVGISAQYLAMEGMRMHDEMNRDNDCDEFIEDGSDCPSIDDLTAEEMFGIEPADQPDENGAPESGSDVHETDACVRESIVATVLESTSATDSTPTFDAPQTLILIDPDAAVLEWVKLVLRDEFRQIHGFQRAEQGLMRIRQYLIRGELPVILISPDVEIDVLSGIHGLGDFIKRLKAQAGRLPIFGLVDGEAQSAPKPQAPLDGVLVRPPRSQLREAQADSEGSFARSLSKAIAGFLSS